MDIRIDDPRKPQISALLADHLTDMAIHSPAESVHALDTEALCASNVIFLAAWQTDTFSCTDNAAQPFAELPIKSPAESPAESPVESLMGCAALKCLNSDHGEIKSMRTSTAFLRRGVARQLLLAIIAIAQQRGLSQLFLETGSADAFCPARSLYVAAGFKYCEPFADYKEDPFSVFMTLSL